MVRFVHVIIMSEGMGILHNSKLPVPQYIVAGCFFVIEGIQMAKIMNGGLNNPAIPALSQKHIVRIFFLANFTTSKENEERAIFFFTYKNLFARKHRFICKDSILNLHDVESEFV